MAKLTKELYNQGCGSAFIWVHGSGTVFRMRIQGYKIKDKSRVKPTIFSFSQE